MRYQGAKYTRLVSVMVELRGGTRHCGERSDEAIQRCGNDTIGRCARNDESQLLGLAPVAVTLRRSALLRRVSKDDGARVLLAAAVPLPLWAAHW